MYCILLITIIFIDTCDHKQAVFQGRFKTISTNNEEHNESKKKKSFCAINIFFRIFIWNPDYRWSITKRLKIHNG